MIDEPLLTKPQGATDSQIPPGTVLFGVYEILGVLGGGGMGWVYRARHKQLSSLRAIKVIRPDLTMDSKLEQLFVREAHALMKIQNDAVVRCHDLLSEDGRIYLIMELVQGPSLEQLLRDGPISSDQVRALKRRIGSGLAAAHALGVIHRDISPGNIILPNSRAEEAKLIDFGVAAVAAIPGQTVVGDFKGKFAYAAPEQFGLFGGKVDACSDVYSFGLVLAEAASGLQLPMGQTFYEAVEVRKVRPRIPPAVPADLQAEILPLLEPDPTERPPASELTKSISDSAVQDKKLNPHADPEPAWQWLIPLLYSASAVGVGIGLGFMFWVYRTAAGPVVRHTQSPPAITTPASTSTATGSPHASRTFGLLPPPGMTPTAQPASFTPTPPVPPAPSGSPTRADVLNTADQLATYVWVCQQSNRRAPCARTIAYSSKWQPGEQVQGLAYNWGGADGPDSFSKKLRRGLGAGSHKWNGVLGCTAGIDCSGFVAYCWGDRSGNHAYSTANMGNRCSRIKTDVFHDLKPGDALTKPGSHIVLFAGYRPNGGPIVYEASGPAGRVIRNDQLSWARLSGYYPVRSNHLVDP